MPCSGQSYFGRGLLLKERAFANRDQRLATMSTRQRRRRSEKENAKVEKDSAN